MALTSVSHPSDGSSHFWAWLEEDVDVPEADLPLGREKPEKRASSQTRPACGARTHSIPCPKNEMIERVNHCGGWGVSRRPHLLAWDSFPHSKFISPCHPSSSAHVPGAFISSQAAKPAFGKRLWLHLVKLKLIHHRILRTGVWDHNVARVILSSSVMGLWGCQGLLVGFCLREVLHAGHLSLGSVGDGSRKAPGSGGEQETPGCTPRAQLL